MAAPRELSCSVSCGTVVPWPGTEGADLALAGEFLTTGPAGRSCQIVSVSLSLNSCMCLCLCACLINTEKIYGFSWFFIFGSYNTLFPKCKIVIYILSRRQESKGEGKKNSLNLRGKCRKRRIPWNPFFPARETPETRSCVPQLESSPHSPQLEKSPQSNAHHSQK